MPGWQSVSHRLVSRELAQLTSVHFDSFEEFALVSILIVRIFDSLSVSLSGNFNFLSFTLFTSTGGKSSLTRSVLSLSLRVKLKMASFSFFVCVVV